MTNWWTELPSETRAEFEAHIGTMAEVLDNPHFPISRNENATLLALQHAHHVALRLREHTH